MMDHTPEALGGDMTTFLPARWLPVILSTLVLAATMVIVGVRVGDAVSEAPSSLVTIVPCRLFDTRADSQVGTRGQPIPADTAVRFSVRGTNGDCTIPSAVTGIATNVTAVNPTASSFLTVYPADAATRPNASNLNWRPSSPPTPNQVTVGLSADGAIDVYNLAGDVDVILDIVGYYVESPGVAPVSTVRSLPRMLQATGNKMLFMGCGGCTSDFVLVSVPAGRWLLSYSLTVVNFTGTSDLFRCWTTTFLPGPVLGLTTSRVGPGADVAGFQGEASVTVTGEQPTLYKIRCSHDSQIGGTPIAIENAYMEFATLTALEVAT
jgi:hypothetical protein